ncbi:MAG: nicotinamide-nucleotide amidase [Cocleimonas sp.]
MTDILEKVSKKLHNRKLFLVSAESCTGGWLAKKMTDLSGSSAIFDRGFVTYSNDSKQDMLGVQKNTIEGFGAVSEEVVKEMANGALMHSKADISVAISGVAGPDGGSEEKPVGMVCFGMMQRGNEAYAVTEIFNGDRDKVRTLAVDFALQEIDKLLK